MQCTWRNVLLGACLCLFHLLSVYGIVPRVCSQNATKLPGICCPVPEGFKNPCGFPGRGVCRRVQPYSPPPEKRFEHLLERDVKHRWPMRVFQYTCECRERFMGVGCEECWYGYHGKNCDERKVLVRRDVRSYSAADKKLFIDVHRKVRQTTSIFDHPLREEDETHLTGKFQVPLDPIEDVALTHWYSLSPLITHDVKKCKKLWDTHWDHGHMDVGFTLYHRYMLLRWERMFQKVAETHFGVTNFTFPYWDWVDDTECPMCTEDFIGKASNIYDKPTKGNFIDNSSYFGSQEYPTYCQGSTVENNHCLPCVINRTTPTGVTRLWHQQLLESELPTSADVVEALIMSQYNNYSSFCGNFGSMLESALHCTCKSKKVPYMLHANVHNFAEGSIAFFPASTYDPLFLIHHAQVDRIFEHWFRSTQPHAAGSVPLRTRSHLQCRECIMGNFYPTLRYREVFASATNLGYTYSNFNFGKLSENVRVAKHDNIYKPKLCEVFSPLS